MGTQPAVGAAGPRPAAQAQNPVSLHGGLTQSPQLRGAATVSSVHRIRLPQVTSDSLTTTLRAALTCL